MKLLLPLLLLFMINLAFADNELSKAMKRLDDNKELYLSIAINNQDDIEVINQYLSINYIAGNTVYAYAHKAGFMKLLGVLNINFKVEQHPSELNDILLSTCSSQGNLRYPSYDSLIAIVKGYETKFPNLCAYQEVGKTVKNRVIPGLILTNKNSKIPKPRVLFCGPPHGNELTGLILNLKMYDTLTSAYTAGNQRIKRILDSVEIWTVTLLNPDGTYKDGNNTISGAQRANANGVDLNRSHLPAPGCQSEASEQVETKALRAFLNKAENHFTLGTDLHDGIEACLIPWSGKSAKHPEDTWYLSAGNYFKSAGGGFSSGVGQCYTLLRYNAPGCFHDFGAYYLKGMKSFCWELSPDQPPPESKLLTYWKKYCNPLLTFAEFSLTGIRGVVLDSLTNTAIPDVKVFISSYDKDSSWVFSYSDGGFYRILNDGTYALTFTKNGYFPKTVSYTLTAQNKTIVSNVLLKPTSSAAIASQEHQKQFEFYNNGNSIIVKNNVTGSKINRIALFDIKGKLLKQLEIDQVAAPSEIPLSSIQNLMRNKVYILRVYTSNSQNDKANTLCYKNIYLH